ncbi:class I SAM-dependent methyltransferase [Ferroacidibacillus organovorans]|uniref:Methyltransferase type 11 domain-containing protein n=1 Tax=Ferroacidibacillus organovorans TaxID=1765683 RepID=A0A162UFY0_9BACL|nr:class I SAM-dependent methyltransferase [Ferroacidibacillus organovorans]KYP81725.1 hypothetical protein AYJ22_06300 [Ferroacidibacillus organovorans]OAG94265.1 hypothetical protein AYW79_06525 [Ferroacidibacillus organovorans]OPG16899.1 hypothetical protein B2M26_04040 [Ferroacidibacillus organovorans]
MIGNELLSERAVTRRFHVVDAVMTEHGARMDATGDRWLLEQTIATGSERRNLLRRIPLVEGSAVLDVGVGFGALAFDVAALYPVRVVGVDQNPEMIDHATVLCEQIRSADGFIPGSTLSFQLGDAQKLPFPDGSFDMVMARFVFQHLSEPIVAAKEIARVLKVGGVACLVDVDEALSLSYPEESSAFTLLYSAFRALQMENGGDRQVGRKLAHYLAEFGELEVIGTFVDHQAHHGRLSDLSMQLTVARFEQVRSDVIERDLLDAERYDHALEAFRREGQAARFQSVGQVTVFAQKKL